jgi:hypothetical protein
VKALLSEAWRCVAKWWTGWLRGGPHFVVGDPANPYLLRWYVIPRNPFLCVYVHKFLRDDDDRALHDHPWPSVSVLLRGRYVEQTDAGRRLYTAGAVVLRRATHAHRVELPGGVPAWTLFVAGPRVREWGFHCPRGWVHWKDFVDPTDAGQVGKGCGEQGV